MVSFLTYLSCSPVALHAVQTKTVTAHDLLDLIHFFCIAGACYYDSNQSMYVFGGCTQSSCNAAFNDLWRLDLNSKEWIRPLASGTSRLQAVKANTNQLFTICGPNKKNNTRLIKEGKPNYWILPVVFIVFRRQGKIYICAPSKLLSVAVILNILHDNY